MLVLNAGAAPGCRAGGGELLHDGATDLPGGAEGLPGGAGPGGAAAGGGVIADDTRPSVSSYVAKVKNLACGEAATAEEVAAVQRDPAALGALVDGWMSSPGYRDKMLAFFGTAFQQANVSTNDLNLLGSSPTTGWYDERAVGWVQQNWPRTVQHIVDEGQPFTAAVNGQQMVVNPFLLSMYAWVDGIAEFRAQNPCLTIYYTARTVAPADSLDPKGPDYMHWTVPGLKDVTWNNAVCATDPIVIDAKTNRKNAGSLPQQLLGFVQGRPMHFDHYTDATHYVDCFPKAGWPTNLASPADANAWRVVTVRAPGPGESPTKFYDLAALRGDKDLLLRMPRAGFMDTLAFQAAWPSNTSNQYRATMNQTLIVALGQDFDGADQTRPKSLAALDQAHAEPGTACYGCHLTLDPMRQFFLQSWNNAGGPQTNKTALATPGQWAWDGVALAGNGTPALAAQLAASPRFARGWTQKVCTYLRSSPCVADDPEFVRIADAFAHNNFDFNAMVRALLLSPLVTFAAPTATESSFGQTFAVNKQVHLCTLLSERLGLFDVCGLQMTTVVPAALAPVATVATVVPADSYSRGAVAPSQANDATLPLLAGAENLCKALANVVVDGNGPGYRSADSDAALSSMVHGLMGIDPGRDAVPLGILRAHYAAALAAGARPTVALRSAFVLACTSPTVVATGL